MISQVLLFLFIQELVPYGVPSVCVPKALQWEPINVYYWLPLIV